MFLKKNSKVDENGYSLVGYDILKDHIDPSLVNKIPFKFNDAENTLIMDLGIDQEYIVEYEKNTIRKQRKFLHFKIIDRKIKGKFGQALESFKEKLANLKDLSKIQETIKDLEAGYDTERTFHFYFNKSRYLHKFYNKKFDIELLDKKSIKKIIFIFRSIEDITPRFVYAKIRQGILLIHKMGPPKTIKHFMDKNYAIIKLYSLQDNHSEEFKNVYDILITCDEKIVGQIFQNNNPNTFFGRYSKDTQNLYISKLIFGEFLKSFGRVVLYVNNLLSNEIVEIPFKEDKFDQFLLKSENLSPEKLINIKEKAKKGFSKYYTLYKKFLEDIKKNRDLDDKNTSKDFESIFENYEKLDFSNIRKREIFDINAKIHFMDNLDILITRDNELKVNYSLDLLQEGLNINFQRAKEIFQKIYEEHISKRNLYKISEEYYKKLYFILKELKFKSMANLHSGFIRDCFYNFSILKKNINFVKQSLGLRNDSLIETGSIVLSAQNAFHKHFPKQSQIVDEFFNSKFTKFSEIKSPILVKLKQYCRDIIYMFEAAQNLLILSHKFADKFQSDYEFKQIIKHIEEKVRIKNLSTEKKFKQIYSEIEEGINYKNESEKKLEEVTDFIETQLKNEFSENDFKKTTKLIEELLKTKLIQKLDFDNILKQINIYFKKSFTKENQINKVVEFIEANLKIEFEDKSKFNSIIKKIRKNYISRIENREKYSKILKEIGKSFEELNTKADIYKIQTYIEKNLNEIFESQRERQSIFRQIDKAYLNKQEHPIELEDIVHLCFAVVRLLITDSAIPSILAGSVFGLFILALNRENQIPLSSICGVLEILPSSFSLQVKKFIEAERVKKGRRYFDNLRITDEETRQEIRDSLVELLLVSQTFIIFKSKKEEGINNLNKKVKEFSKTVSFFIRYDQFTSSLEKAFKRLITKFIKEFISEIKQTTKLEDKDLKLSKLTRRLIFFNNFSNFRKYLIPLTSEIKKIYTEIPKSISDLFKK